MTDNIESMESPEINEGIDEAIENEKENEIVEPKIKNVEMTLTKGIVRRSDKTVKETVKDRKQRAIDNFKNGMIDPEYRVVQMANGKYRTYKRKTPLEVEPINVNQIQPNKPLRESSGSCTTTAPTNQPPPKITKTHSPFDDIVYYNMTNQISEQLNKRLDMVNAEIERLRQKNTKLKGKYKQLKQAIYITEEEEKDEQSIHEQHEQSIHEQHEPSIQPQQPLRDAVVHEMQESNQLRQPQHLIHRTPNGINFNRFFQ